MAMAALRIEGTRFAPLVSSPNHINAIRSSMAPTDYLNNQMASIFGPVSSVSGIIYPRKLLDIQKLNVNGLKDCHKSCLVFERISRTRRQYFVREGYGAKYAISVGRNHHELSVNNDIKKWPFWIAPTRGFFGCLKSLFAFLVEQPSQLKYIEWPGFQNTLKTATLTLVLVAMLIVVLSSVDSGLWYLLVLILRKPA